MSNAGVATYAIAGLGFLFLTLLLAISWRGRRVGARLIGACAATCVWAFLFAVEARLGSAPLLVVYVAEVLRDAVWILVLTELARPTAPRLLLTGAHVLWIGLLVFALATPWLPGFGSGSMLLSRSGLLLTLCVLILLEQIYRNASHAGRNALRYVVLGIGGMFAYDLFLYSQAELLRRISIDAWIVRGIVTALAVPMIALAARRNPQWSLEVFVSRQVVFYTTTFVAVGIYLIAMAITGYVMRDLGGDWGAVGQILFFAGAAVVLGFLLLSGVLRRQVLVFISKHFYSNKYDYRIEWLRFIRTLSTATEEDARRTAIRAVAQIFDSPAGLLFVADERGRQFVPVSAWPMKLDDVSGLAPLCNDCDLVKFVRKRQWIVDLHEHQRMPDVYENIELPAWLARNVDLRIVSPLPELDRLFGFFVLYDPPPPFELTYEDRDLLKTVGRHVATQLAQHDADRRLAESRQFEAYNRLTAFMMHDLKNSVAQLQLIVTNAPRHKHNPEFVDDTIETIDNTVDRMTRLIEQLRQSTAGHVVEIIRLDDMVRNTVDRCSLRAPVPRFDTEERAIHVKADPQRLSAVVEHIIRNAQDAAPAGEIVVRLSSGADVATLTVTDNGKGMDAEFVRERLFRPFDSTKGSKGMGIGAYQTREYVQMLGGYVEVQSSPGRGTRFSITLPTEPFERPVRYGR
ncbi:MAG TPA: PEP-CTERM system histidine kinase PrsK [Povalibacter sp.]|uniref:XrtA/PEP-CTERM system histidine kinase PrsK n=1 Tax=Povalibacter sp. TaxID=1962978 RepID=UPI002CED7EE4|nr:XrtA/PEP-CTERM system histidine kinase PrsK [Povalibacter sp.]HMN42954.1 PEP-CTERM system histidine kinase PrsK [Povalibacter sp.]